MPVHGLYSGGVPDLLAEAEEDGRFHRRWLGALAGGVLLALPMALLRAQGMERALSLTPLRALAVGLVEGVGTVVPGLSTSFILINLGLVSGLSRRAGHTRRQACWRWLHWDLRHRRWFR